MSTERRIATPAGEARLVTNRSRHPVATLLLSHGAGNGIDTPDLEALARHLPRNGITVIRLEQPWKVAGRRIATAPATLDDGLLAAADQLRVRTPLVIGGRSAGARSAVRCATSLGAVGCLALAFPLHPPGRPEKSRLPELRGARLPTLVVQGERDPPGRPEAGPDDVAPADGPAADPRFTRPVRGGLSPEEAMGIVVEAALEWIVREVIGAGNGSPG